MLDQQSGGGVLSQPATRPPAGFTLIELLIGIAIMSIVLALGMPSYKAWIQNTKIRTAAESIVYGLQIARAAAVSRNEDVGFTLVSGSNWTVGCFTVTADCPANIQSRAAGDGSSGAITVAAAGAMPFTIIFTNLGRMRVPALVAPNTFTSINVDVDPAILSAAQSRDLRVTVDVGGRIRMCDPAVPMVVPPDPRACNS